MCDNTKGITGNRLNPSGGSIAVIGGNVTISENILQTLERCFRAPDASQKKFAVWCKTPGGKGIRPEMALLSIARRLAGITLVLWKRGEAFDVAKLISN